MLEISTKEETMNIVCLDAKTLGSDINLQTVFEKFGNFTGYDYTDPAQAVQRLKNADIVITNKVLITKEVIEATNLKLICVSATGVNNVDLDAAKEALIPVKNVAGYSTNSVAQQTFANLLTLINQTKYYDDYCKMPSGWASSQIFSHLDRAFFELDGKSFGIVGLGSIGKKVAQIAQAFGCEVCYYSTSKRNNDTNYKQVNLNELLKCDIISIHAPLNENTKNLFNQEVLSGLKQNAILMNYGRGGIVDENAVAALIDSGKIYFATDVLEKEPIRKDHPFLNLKNKDRLIMTPHVAWASVEARKRLVDLIAKNIENFLEG